MTEDDTAEGPVLDQLDIIVRDMEASAAFYRRLGLTVDEGGPPQWAPHHRTVTMPDGGDLDLELDSIPFVAHWDAGWRQSTTGGVVIGFRVPTRDHVDRLYAEITGAGYRGQQPPFDAFWGARYAIVEDPDGNPVGLMSPVDPARATPPPPPPS